MSRVLLLGSGTQGLALVDSLHRLGHYIVLLINDRGNYADKSRYVNKLYFFKGLSSDFVRAINDIIAQENIDVIIPLGDEVACFLSQNRSAISDKAKYKLPSYENFLRGYDKNKLMNLCSQKGYPHPLTIDLSQIPIDSKIVREFDFPGMLKPNQTTGGRGMIEVYSFDELSKQYPLLHARYGDYHLQKFIKAGGKQEKIQLYIDEGQNILAYSVQQKLRWYPNKGGSNTCAVSINDMEMVNICHKILKDIGWIGFADFDLIQNPDTNEMLIMEINPRVPACIKGSIVAGIDWAEIIINGYLGLPQKKYTYKEGVIVRHLGLDFLWFMSAKNRWRTKPSWFWFIDKNVYFQDMNGWRDPLPFIIGSLNNIRKILNPRFRKAKCA